MQRSTQFALIAGSSFSGSLLAWILAKQGYAVSLVDRQRHPRFAIGESSTPTADFLLASIAERWDLSELAPLACWGSWKRAYPQLRCGKKRGFSYFGHEAENPFVDNERRDRSLLVAASACDEFSDTHWLREDVDAFLHRQAVSAGAVPHEATAITGVEWDPKSKTWLVSVQSMESEVRQIRVRWMIDASGAGGAFTKWLGQRDDSHWMRTRTGALYGHVEGLAPFTSNHYSADDLSNDPFDGDDSAQHHVTENGWYWVLRFDHGVTSMGLVQPSDSWPNRLESLEERRSYWRSMLDRYPSIAALVEHARWRAPSTELRFQRRLSRCLSPVVGRNWMALPTSAGFIDPLHSTGIAHALSGVVRTAELLIEDAEQPGRAREKWARYGRDIRQELDWLDLLVAGCYGGLPSFRRFRSFACFYFIAAIEFEKQLSRDPFQWDQGFLMCDDRKLAEAANCAFQSVSTSRGLTDDQFEEMVRSLIEPWNSVGLLSPGIRNRLAHTAAPKFRVDI